MSSGALSQIHTYAGDIERVRAGSTPHQTPPVAPRSKPVVVDTPATPSTGHTPTASTLKQPVAANPIKKSSVVPDAPIKITTTATRDASYPATIITDKKRAKMDLSAEVTNALGNWWKEKVKSVSQTKKRTYSVPAASMRKGVIETATSHTGRTATTDHAEIVARLKAEKSKRLLEKQSPQVIQPAPTKPAPITSWDTAMPSTDITQDKTVVPTPATTTTHNIESYPVPQPLPVTPERIEPAIPQIQQQVTETILPKPPKIISPTPPVIARDAVSPLTALTSAIKPQIPSTLKAVRASVANRKEELAENQTILPKREFVIPWHLAPYIAGVAVLVIGTSITGWYALTQTSQATPPLTTSLPQPTQDTSSLSVNSPAVTATLEAPNKTALFKSISTAAGSGDAFFVVTPLAFNTNLPLTSDEILLLMNRQFEPAVLSTINDVLLGTYRGEPVIILKTDNESALKGHLFSWEQTLSRDLSPWFGSDAVTSTSTRSGFTDSSSAGKDIRVWVDDAGTEHIVYGFVNPNTVIITSDNISFLNLSQTYVQ